jgi:hypothetical protein
MVVKVSDAGLSVCGMAFGRARKLQDTPKGEGCAGRGSSAEHNT